MKASKLLSILFIAGTLTLGLTVSQSVFASDADGPPGSPHQNPDVPLGNPHLVPGGETTTGNPHHGDEDAPPPGYGDPHQSEARGDPHGPRTITGNPHVNDPRPGHANLGESESSASHGEPTFDDFPGEGPLNNFAGEPVSNEFPGEPTFDDFPGEGPV